MSRNILISVLCSVILLIGHNAFAASRGYEVTGTVLEAGSENPVPGAAVKLGEDLHSLELILEVLY